MQKVLTKKPVTIKVRNQSQDDLLQLMISIKNKLEELAELAEEKDFYMVLTEIIKIKLLTREIFEKCSPTSKAH
ncbi:MAG TPA: hypothetical protein VGM30_21500 [Puia sp.]|jgi:hypothetical protein